MDDLITWLRGVLDQDEARVGEYLDDWQPADDYDGGDSVADMHRARWATKDIAAKRSILEEHGIIWRDIGWLEPDGDELVEESAELPVCVRCVPRHSHFRTRQDVPEGACRTVRLLGSAYADRPGYRDEWRP